MTKLLLLCFAVCSFSLSTFAEGESGVWFSPALGYNQNSGSNQPTLLYSAQKGSKEVATDLNLQIGYKFDFGLYLGFNYLAESGSIESTTSSTLTTTSTYTGYGLSIGYVHASGFFVTYAFLTAPVLTYTQNSNTVRYSGGTGSKLDIGYFIPITPTIGVGPYLSSVVNSYKKQEYNGSVDLSPSYDVTATRLMAGAGFMF